jgi:hypothetical protein
VKLVSVVSVIAEIGVQLLPAQRSTRYRAMLTLSVAALQATAIVVGAVALALTPVGALGAWVSVRVRPRRRH